MTRLAQWLAAIGLIVSAVLLAMSIYDRRVDGLDVVLSAMHQCGGSFAIQNGSRWDILAGGRVAGHVDLLTGEVACE